MTDRQRQQEDLDKRELIAQGKLNSFFAAAMCNGISQAVYA